MRTLWRALGGKPNRLSSLVRGANLLLVIAALLVGVAIFYLDDGDSGVFQVTARNRITTIYVEDAWLVITDWTLDADFYDELLDRLPNSQSWFSRPQPWLHRLIDDSLFRWNSGRYAPDTHFAAPVQRMGLAGGDYGDSFSYSLLWLVLQIASIPVVTILWYLFTQQLARTPQSKWMSKKSPGTRKPT